MLRGHPFGPFDDRGAVAGKRDHLVDAREASSVGYALEGRNEFAAGGAGVPFCLFLLKGGACLRFRADRGVVVEDKFAGSR